MENVQCLEATGGRHQSFMASKKHPKIALLKYCQPTGLKNKSPRLETMCNALKRNIRKKDQS